MDFSAKLNVVFKTLKIKNSVISQMSGVDASLISRFRSGGRVPKPNSPQLHKMCVSVVEYLEETDRISILNSICSFPKDLAGDPLVSALKVWLLSSNPIKNSTINLKTEDNSPKYLKNFGKKLDAIMGLLHLSNINLSKSLDVDPSLVSRFRNGSRTPSTKNSSLQEICEYLYNVAVEKNMTYQFFKLIDINPASLNNNKEALINYFTDWMCDKIEISNHTAVSSFLYNLDYFTNNVAETPDTEEIFDSSTYDDTRTQFIGIDGFRDAVKKLTYMALTSEPTDVYIYSDQDFEWINAEEGYADRLITCFIKHIQRGGNINIVHSMNHTPSDMRYEIEKLLPLTATGKLKSYYHNEGSVRAFSQTMIIIKGMGALISHSVYGAENMAEYDLITDPNRIDFYQKQFDILLGSSKPLIYSIDIDENKTFPVETYDVIPNSRISLQYTLPIIGLTEKMLEELISFNRLSETNANKVRELYKERVACVNYNKKDTFTEYLPLVDISLVPSNDKLKTTSLSELRRDTSYELVPVNIEKMQTESGARPLYYSREVYVAHIKNLIKLMTKNENLRIVPVEYKTYKTIKLMIVQDCCIANCEGTSPITLVLNHSMINSLVEKYIESLQSIKYPKNPSDEDILKILESYIRFW